MYRSTGLRLYEGRQRRSTVEQVMMVVPSTVISPRTKARERVSLVTWPRHSIHSPTRAGATNSEFMVIVATTLSVGNIILLESVLSFLGLGIQPPIASWGNMLNNAQELIYEAPLLAFYPGLAIFVTVVAFNFLGDGLQDALDPRASRR
jgi:hypothetical protein